MTHITIQDQVFELVTIGDSSLHDLVLRPIPVKQERWRADIISAYYWFIDSDGTINYTRDNRDNLDDERYEIGNYFKSEKIAQSVADAMKALLTFCHSSKDDKTEIYQAVYKAISIARQALQRGEG